MLNWLRKKLGCHVREHHVCEEFTRWETRHGRFVRQTMPDEWYLRLSGVTTVRFMRRWQERRCTICGKVEQRDLKR